MLKDKRGLWLWVPRKINVIMTLKEHYIEKREIDIEWVIETQETRSVTVDRDNWQ